MTNSTSKHGPVQHKILSDHGVWLEKGNRMNQDSNQNRGMPVFSFLDTKGTSISVQVGQKCPVCKKSVRGLNHENGDHHKQIVIRHASR